MRIARADAIALGVILYVLVALSAIWAPHSFWTSDALFYRASVLEIQGTDEDEALREVWSGPLAEGFRATDSRRAPEDQALADPRWIPHSSEFFERRQFVPLLAAIADPIAGEDGLEAVSVLGFFAFGLLLYALLRTRFDPLPSGLAACLCLVWPPVWWAFMPLTESWGLALVTLGMLAAVRVLDGADRRWLWAWAGAVLVLGFTRDLTPVLVLGAAGAWVAVRTPAARTLTITGVLAALPAPLLGGAALREQLAYGFSGNRVPADDSWGFVLGEYFGRAGETLGAAAEGLVTSGPRFIEQWGPLWPWTLPLLAGLAVVVVVRSARSGDAFPSLLRGGLLGALAVMALNPVFNQFRYQLVLLPLAAAGLALLVDTARSRAAAPES